MTRVVILSQDCILDGRPCRKGEVVQVADETKPKPVKLVDNFNEDCIKSVLVGTPIVKPIVKPIKDEIK